VRQPLSVAALLAALAEHARAAGISNPKLLEYQGAWGAGEEYAYEALNFADGRRNVHQIADELSAEYGPVAVDLVREYLEALQQIGVVE
jgi:aminopeptidase YwaD